VASFLLSSRPMTARRSFSGLTLLLLLAACGDGKTGAAKGGTPASRGEGRNTANAAENVLTVTGALTFAGASPYFCVPNPAGGVQIDYRTGDPALPAVAVRLADYRGSGPYSARLFVNGRSESGALVTSTGSANVEVRQENAGAAVLLDGTFRGEYRGDAGTGEIRGSFRSCGYSAGAGVSVQQGAPPITNGMPAGTQTGAAAAPAEGPSTLSAAAPSH
jgi:hypothetical protein